MFPSILRQKQVGTGCTELLTKQLDQLMWHLGLTNHGAASTWQSPTDAQIRALDQPLSAQEQSIRTNYILTNLAKLPSHPFVGCVVQEMRLYLI